MGTAHNVAQGRWRQRRLTMSAFKLCKNVSGEIMTVSVELVRGGVKEYHVIANHWYFEGKRMKILKRSRIPERL